MIRPGLFIVWTIGPEEGHCYRILEISTDGTSVALFNLTTRALASWYPTSDIQQGLNSGLIVEAKEAQKAPFLLLASRDEDDIELSHRQQRDKAWAKLRPALEGLLGDIYNKEERARILASTGYSLVTAYKYCRNYWAAGKHPNGLLPNWDKCGGRGKRKTSGTKKRGRPSKITITTGIVTGSNMDKAKIDRMVNGLVLFYETQQKFPFPLAYEWAVRRYFVGQDDPFEITSGGIVIPRLLSSDNIPTLDQARYWYKEYRDKQKVLEAREGPRRARLNHRPVLGDSSRLSQWPYATYQIDATVADVHLVSAFDRSRLIGRPVLYLVTDAFSRMIAGFAVSLSGPSWDCALEAVANAFTSKVAYCKTLGIEINHAEWPTEGMPESFLADNGEFEGYNATTLTNDRIRVSNTPPFFPDWKPFVESRFGLIKERIRWVPGFVHSIPQRGDRDTRLDATLTLHAFRKVIVYSILQYNNTHRLNDYPMTQEMLADNLEPYPCRLWRWGMRNHPGGLPARVGDLQVLKYLPKGEATITQHGIRFNQLYYDCDLAREDGWYHSAKNNTKKIPISYHSSSTNTIYLRLDAGRQIIPCTLMDRGTERTFAGQDWQDVLHHFVVQACAKNKAAFSDIQARASYQLPAEEVVKTEQILSKQAQEGASKRQRLGDSKANRAAEKALTELAQSPACSRNTSSPAPDKDEYIPPAQHYELFKSMPDDEQS